MSRTAAAAPRWRPGSKVSFCPNPAARWMYGGKGDPRPGDKGVVLKETFPAGAGLVYVDWGSDTIGVFAHDLCKAGGRTGAARKVGKGSTRTKLPEDVKRLMQKGHSFDEICEMQCVGASATKQAEKKGSGVWIAIIAGSVGVVALLAYAIGRRRAAGGGSLSGIRDRLPGGEAAGRDPSEFDAFELRRGTLHELEHTKDWVIAQEIAMDHLAENPRYYDALERAGL